MITLARRTGTRCLRWLMALTALAVVSAGAVRAQESLKTDDRNKLDNFRAGNPDKLTPDLKEVCDRAARYYAARLVDQKTREAVEGRGESRLVNDLIQQLGLTPHNADRAAGNEYSRLPQRRPFVEEFGKSLVATLEGSATKGGDPIIQINANRMIAEVCRAGYDGAAEVCLKVLAKPDANDAAKFYALQGLKNLFAIMPNPGTRDDPGIPEKTVFQKDNTGNLSPLEVRCIQALIDFVFRKPTAELSPQDADVQFYVRREAVRALAWVRVQQAKEKGKVVSRPALALLRIARGDGVNPPSMTPQGSDVRAAGERFEAIIGFCSLVPPRTDRDMNIDYAVYHIGRAIQDLTPLYKVNSRDTSTPWKTEAIWVRDALNTWKTRAVNLQDGKKIQDLYDVVERDILKPMEESKEDSHPDATNLDQWLKANPPTSKSLFKNDDKTTINAP
jgi:hypothetical protein